MVKLGLVLVLVMAACDAGGKAEVDEDFSDLAGVDQKADYFSYRMRLLGELGDGGHGHTTYSKTPRFRAYQLLGHEGDSVDVWVRSSRGDALAWLVDGRFKTILKNDDADDSTRDAHLSATLPPSANGKYYVIFRDYHLERRVYDVQVAIHPADSGGRGWYAAAQNQARDLIAAFSGLDALKVDMSQVPGPAQARVDAIVGGGLEVPLAYRPTIDGHAYYLILATDGSGEGNVVVADLIDPNGFWFAHGIARNLWDGGGGIDWSLDSEDPSMCSCPSDDAPSTCTWLDGATSDGARVCE